MDKLLSILSGVCPDLDFEKEESLIDDGKLDSFSVITIVSEINDAFNVEVTVSDLIPENFNSAKAMWRLINHLKK